MVKDAEANADADKERKALAEARNQSEATIHQTEKALQDFGDKISEEEKKEIEGSVAALKEVLANEEATAETINESAQALLQASMKLGEAMYKANAEADAAADAAADEAQDAGSDEDVVDADFEEVDGEKKD